MKSTGTKKVRMVFEQRLKQAFPQFVQVKSEGIPASDRLFEWQMGDNLCSYLLLCAGKANELRFTLDVAWSRKCRFPTHLLPMNPIDIPERRILRDQPKDGEFRTRIGDLFPPYRDYWWKVTDCSSPGEMSFDAVLQFALHGNQTEPNEKLIGEKVDDALARIRDFVVPYLESVCKCS